MQPTDFAAITRGPDSDIDLVPAALAIADLVDPSLDDDIARSALETLAERVRVELGDASSPTVVTWLHSALARFAKGAEVMAVRGTVMFEAAPEDMPAFVTLAGDVRGILTRLGAKEVRFWSATVAGPNSGRVSLAAEFEDMAAWGAAQEAYASDAEFQALASRAVGSQVGRAVWTEIAPS